MFKIAVLVAILALASASYSETLGKNLCMLTVASYCNPTKINNWSCPPCQASALKMSNVKVITNSTMDTLGFIATSKDLNSIGNF